MSEDSVNPQSSEKKAKAPRPIWLKALCVLGWVSLAIFILVAVAITVAVNYLKPERLTPLIEQIANDNLNGRLKLDRVEISFYSTFPKFVVDVDGLTLVTDAFKNAPDSVASQLPAYADTLLSVAQFDGAINIPSLLRGSIRLYDISLHSPCLNFVQATPEMSSLDIFSSAEKDEAEEESPLLVPKIELGTFSIEGGFPVRYVSLPDSVKAEVKLSATRLDGNKAPSYRLEITGLTSASIPNISVDNLGFGIGGDVVWDPSHPLRASFNEFTLSVGEVKADVSSAVEFGDTLRVESFRATLPETPATEIIALVPESMRGELGKMKAGFSIAADMELTKPYTVGTDSIPSADISIDIPRGSLGYDGMRLDILEAEVSASIDGQNPDGSIVDIKKLKAQGEGMGFLLAAKVTTPISDPSAKGTFKGGMSFAKLPGVILRQLPATVKGLLKANCEFDLRRSYLDKDNFHRIRLRGDATLTDLSVDMPELPGYLNSKTITLKLGTNSSFTRMGATADSLLTASIKADTISCLFPGLEAQGRGLMAGVGVKNVANSLDTTAINPIGGRIVAERLMLKSSEDSVRVRLRKATVGASLTRYKGETRKPLLHLDISAERAMYGDRLNRATLREASAVVTVHPSAPRSLSPRRKARLDSLAAAHPELSADSVRRLEARIAYERRRARMASTDTVARETLDLEVDNTLKRILLLWRADGHLKAKRMRLFTPLFPVRNRVSHLDVTFNSDSVTVTDTRFKVGRSDFMVNGTVSNITRALTSSTGRQSLVADFSLSADTIDINEISGAVFAGAAFAENDNGLLHITATDDPGADESGLEATIAGTAATDSATVLVIPSNIEANISVKARNITYSNLIFKDFNGVMNVYRGALNLSSMEAHTDVGSIGLNALYSAPDKHEASFAFGLNVKDFHIAEFLRLVPAIDSVMPLLQSIGGIINADIAATTDIDSAMNIDIPTLRAAVKISGNSLKVTDDETFRKIGKWLLFKHKERNIIDSMNVEMIIENSSLRLFPFMFNLDRYKLGVMGSNDMNMNLDYHVAVLKSPLPFKFGINITGNIDKMKIRLGGAKFNEKNMAKTVSIADTTRINLVNEIRNVFRRGVRNARVKSLSLSPVTSTPSSAQGPDTISHADSLYFIREGLIAAPDTVKATAQPGPDTTKQRQQRKKSRK